jgi:hypothetical protein
MVIVRDVVRDRMLEPVFRLNSLQVQSQTGVLVLFLLLFVVGLATVAWMWRVYAARPRSS